MGSAKVHHEPQVNRAHSEPVKSPHIPKATPTLAAGRGFYIKRRIGIIQIPDAIPKADDEQRKHRHPHRNVEKDIPGRLFKNGDEWNVNQKAGGNHDRHSNSNNVFPGFQEFMNFVNYSYV
ncbi:hypothetical protein [Rhodohalobacter sp.]|uniref:hypothetical protein n=1 Tax=Rhodohalobacter sp. TaxID=1974210 RepID=UPI002ACF070D|nr:hypothetical protein [Rhodohalobacter sp.]